MSWLSIGKNQPEEIEQMKWVTHLLMINYYIEYCDWKKILQATF